MKCVLYHHIDIVHQTIMGTAEKNIYEIKSMALSSSQRETPELKYDSHGTLCRTYAFYIYF
mgnify:CR=1 FL=1